MANSVGYLLGAMIGWLYKWLPRQPVLVAMVALMGATTMATAHYPSFALAIGSLLVNGIASGAWDTSSGFWIVELFPTGNAALLQLQQALYGFGSVAAPLLAAPFVKGETLVEPTGGPNGTNVTITPEDRVHNLTLPFIYAGAGHLLFSALLLITYFTNRYEPPSKTTDQQVATTENFSQEKEGQVILEEEPEKEEVSNRILKLSLCAFLLAIYGSAELGWFNFATTMWQYLEIHLDAPTAAQAQSILSGAYAFGRLLSAFISIKVVPQIVLSYHFLIMATGLSTLYFGQHNKSVIFGASAVLGYGFSAMWPAIFAFAEEHFRLTDRAYSSFTVLSGIISLTFPLVLGQTFRKRPIMLFLLEGSFLVIACGVFAAVSTWIFVDRRRRRSSKR